MPVKFKDYYETLGVARDATQDEIRKAFRKLARRYHPDVNKGEESEEKFKEINEAYEVLSDPEKRKRYNSLGSRWQAGQDFRPPPGFEGGTFHFGGTHDLGGLGDFSDFFNVLFGEHLGGFQGAHPGSTSSFGERGRDREAEIHVSLEEAFHGAKKKIEFETRPRAAGSRSESQRKAYEVAIPKGVIDGSKIRLSGQGEAGFGGAPSGDLYLVVRLIPHPRFEVQGHDLKTTLRMTPWEAALGADLSVRTPGGSVTMKVPAATGSGQTFRLRGRGLPHRRGEPGDLFVTVQIAVPKRLSSREKELFEELARISEFEPER